MIPIGLKVLFNALQGFRLDQLCQRRESAQEISVCELAWERVIDISKGGSLQFLVRRAVGNSGARAEDTVAIATDRFCIIVLICVCEIGVTSQLIVVPRPPLGSKGIVPISIKVILIVQLL